MTNSAELLDLVPEAERGSFLQIGSSEVTKALGTYWVPLSDTLNYYYEPVVHQIMTKRNVLSESSKLFDPLGLIQPVVVKSKIFLQHLWNLKLDWDTELPQHERDIWHEFRNQLPMVKLITAPRYLLGEPDPIDIQLHGFCDASEKAYGAALYLRSVCKDGTVKVNLIAAKTRVAPLQKITLARLELSGASLLADLWSAVRPLLSLPISCTHLWTDSMITIKWLIHHPSKWTTYVANRTSNIRRLTANCTWRHVPGTLNPADCASRGLWPNELVTNEIWFHGPEFLTRPESEWPGCQDLPDEAPEAKTKQFTLLSHETLDCVAANKYHSYHKVRRVFAYVHMFINCLKMKAKSHSHIDRTKEQKQLSKLTVEDLNNGLLTAVRFVQHASFNTELQILNNQKSNYGRLPKPLRKLSPILHNGIIRVGGRLDHALELSHDQKYPILLPRDHPLTKSIFLWTHHATLHSGPTALLATVQQQFWIQGGKIVANSVVHGCPRCVKAKPVVMS